MAIEPNRGKMRLMIMRPIAVLLLTLAGCTATGSHGAAGPVGTRSPTAPTPVPIPIQQSVVSHVDGVCDQREGPNQLIVLRPSNSGPAVQINDGGPLGITVVLPAGGFRSLAVDAPTVVKIERIPSPGSKHKFLQVVGPGVAHLTAISGTGQHFSLTLRIHC